MSIKEKTLEKIAVKISHYHRLKPSKVNLLKKRLWILYHEIIRDDVAIRAESLSYFTLFSIMPIIAGLFLILTAFSQWAPVQGDFQELIERVLAPLPEEHRKNLLAFLFEFKDVYLEKMSQAGSSLGIFATVVLIFVLGKVFLNLEDLMNRVWLTGKNRPWTDRLRNLILAMVILPTSIFVALSLPGAVQRFGGVNLGIFVEKGLPAILLVSGLFFLFRYFPNVDVKPKNAWKGAMLSSVLFLFSNFFLTIYFKFGTQTAYGKAAVIPLVAFFIYITWFIIMIGAEWSYLLQNESHFTDEALKYPNLQEAAVLLSVLRICEERHRKGLPPITNAELMKAVKVNHRSLTGVLHFLIEQGILIASSNEGKREMDGVFYAFSYAPENINLIKTVKEYLKIDQKEHHFDVETVLKLLCEK